MPHLWRSKDERARLRASLYTDWQKKEDIADGVREEKAGLRIAKAAREAADARRAHSIREAVREVEENRQAAAQHVREEKRRDAAKVARATRARLAEARRVETATLARHRGHVREARAHAHDKKGTTAARVADLRVQIKSPRKVRKAPPTLRVVNPDLLASESSGMTGSTSVSSDSYDSSSEEEVDRRRHRADRRPKFHVGTCPPAFGAPRPLPPRPLSSGYGPAGRGEASDREGAVVKKGGEKAPVAQPQQLPTPLLLTAPVAVATLPSSAAGPVLGPAPSSSGTGAFSPPSSHGTPALQKPVFHAGLHGIVRAPAPSARTGGVVCSATSAEVKTIPGDHSSIRAVVARRARTDASLSFRPLLVKARLSSFPTSVLAYPHLEALDLSGNLIVQVPDLDAMTSLTWLSLSTNRLGEFPSGIFPLCSLRSLFLDDNYICQVPSRVSRLSSLHELSLSRTGMSTLPPELSFLSELRVLDVSSNLIGELPLAMSTMTSLTTVDVSHNKLTSLHPLEHVHADVMYAGNPLSKEAVEAFESNRLLLIAAHPSSSEDAEEEAEAAPPSVATEPSVDEGSAEEEEGGGADTTEGSGEAIVRWDKSRFTTPKGKSAHADEDDETTDLPTFKPFSKRKKWSRRGSLLELAERIGRNVKPGCPPIAERNDELPWIPCRRARVKVTHPFEGASILKELKLKKGDLLVLLSKRADGWGMGSFANDHIQPPGLFPLNYAVPTRHKYHRLTYVPTDLKEGDPSMDFLRFHYNVAMRVDLMERTGSGFCRVKLTERKTGKKTAVAGDPFFAIRMCQDRRVHVVLATQPDLNAFGKHKLSADRPRVRFSECLGVYVCTGAVLNNKKLARLSIEKESYENGEVELLAAFDGDIDRKLFRHPSADGERSTFSVVVDVVVPSLSHPVRFVRRFTVKVYETQSEFRIPAREMVPTGFYSTYYRLVNTLPYTAVLYKLSVAQRPKEGKYHLDTLRITNKGHLRKLGA